MPADLGYSEVSDMVEVSLTLAVHNLERSVALTAIFYTLMVILVPLVTYSFSKSIIFDGLLGLDNSTGTTAAAISAVVGVHVVLVFFIIAAYREDKRQVPPKRD